MRASPPLPQELANSATTPATESPSIPLIPVINLPVDVTLALLATYLIWGSTYLAIRYVLVTFPPQLMIGMRFMTAGGILWIIQKARRAPMPTPQQWLHSGIVGVLLLACGMGTVAIAEQWVASGLTAVVVAGIPIWTAMFGMLWGQRAKRVEWIGMFIGLAGVAILSLENGFQANPLGLLLLLGASLSWSFGSTLSKRLNLPPGPTGFMAEMLIGGAVVFVVGLVRGEQITMPIQASAVAAWVYLVTFGSLVAFTAYMFLLDKVKPALATSYAFVNPVIAVVLGIAIGGEKIGGMAFVALGLIIVALAFIALGNRTKKMN